MFVRFFPKMAICKANKINSTLEKCTKILLFSATLTMIDCFTELNNIWYNVNFYISRRQVPPLSRVNFNMLSKFMVELDLKFTRL